MNPVDHVRIKICCISSVAEAQAAMAMGAAALGLVSRMPSGPGVISDDLIAEIAAAIPPGVASFLLTSEQNAEAIIAQQRHCGVNTVQIVDELEQGTHEDLCRAMPGVGIVQVIHVTGPESIEQAVKASAHVDAILLDSGRPQLTVKELGGTGRTHDWSVSREIRERISVPMYLAGGLNPENVTEAVMAVRPFGVDICSGVRSEGRLDEQKLERFVYAVRNSSAVAVRTNCIDEANR